MRLQRGEQRPPAMRGENRRSKERTPLRRWRRAGEQTRVTSVTGRAGEAEARTPVLGETTCCCRKLCSTSLTLARERRFRRSSPGGRLRGPGPAEAGWV